MKSRTIAFEAIGTHWQIDCQAQLGDDEWQQLISSVKSRIELFDRTYSRFRDDSLVTTMARLGGTFELPSDAKKLMDQYRSLYELTNGAFTPLIGNILSDSGYDASYSFVEKPLRKPSTWDEALLYNFPSLSINTGEILDFGAGGKGYLIDIVASILVEHGINSFCVDAGGDIFQRSETNTPLSIGLEDPQDTSLAIGIAALCNRSIAGSAGNRRKWGKYHHIFDPHTKDSTYEVLATWVVADTALLADSLATCLFFVPPETLLEKFSFEYLVLYPDRSTIYSQNFPAKLF